VALWYQRLTLDEVRPSLPPGLPSLLVETLHHAWKTYPIDRPSAKELLLQLKNPEILHAFGLFEESSLV